MQQVHFWNQLKASSSEFQENTTHTRARGKINKKYMLLDFLYHWLAMLYKCHVITWQYQRQEDSIINELCIHSISKKVLIQWLFDVLSQD